MRRAAFYLFLSFVLCRSLQAQSSDWAVVERLPIGTRVMVVTTRRDAPCTINSVSDAGMECVLSGSVYWVDRASIDSVALHRRRATKIAAAVGAAAAGTADGIILERPSQDPAILKVAGIGLAATVGAGVGFLVGRIVDGSRRDVILYQRP